MTYHIDKKLMLEDLKECLYGVDKGSSMMNGSDSFIFHDGYAYASDGIVAVKVPLRQEAMPDGAVDANTFWKTLNGLPQDTFDIKVDKDTWKLSCGRVHVSFLLRDIDFESRFHFFEGMGDWQEIPEDMLTAMRTCQLKSNKSTLSGIYFNSDTVVSTDNYQLNAYHMMEGFPKPFWLSDRCLSVILKLKDIQYIMVEDKWVRFKTASGAEYSMKPLVASRYPYEKVKKMISPDLTDSIASGKLPLAVYEAIDRAITFGTDSEDSVRKVVCLDLSPDHVSVTSEGMGGTYSEDVEWDAPIKDFAPLTLYVDKSLLDLIPKEDALFHVMGTNSTPILVFTTDRSVHVYSTYKGKG